MYYVEEITYFVQEEGLSTFIDCEKQYWDSWLLQQPGVVRKELWIDPIQPYMVKVVVTWYSTDFAQQVDGAQVEEIREQVKAAMGDYAMEMLKSKSFLSKTTIDNGMADDDDDQDDDDNTDSDEYIPDDDGPSMVDPDTSTSDMLDSLW